LKRLQTAMHHAAVTFTRVDQPEKCLEVLPLADPVCLVYCDEFKPEARNDFFRQLEHRFSRQGLHVIVYSASENTAMQCGMLYTAGVVDHLPTDASFNYIATRLEVYIRLHKKKKRIRELLENMLPPAVVDELEHRKKFPPRRHGLASVMFTDFVRFTEQTEKVQPVELVNLLDFYYRSFDKIIQEHKLEKIKTIGDAYMCAGDVPKRIGFSPVRITLAAIAIRSFMEKTARQNRFKGKPVWEIRIGINCGHLVSGIVGHLKYAYDIWGETVNVAARMENSGVPGQINISQQTYDLIKEYFDCEYRGSVAAKYMGNVNMYLVRGIKKEYSVSGNGHTPTQALKQLAGIIHVNYEGARDYMMTRLKNELPDYLQYHGWHHTQSVLQAVEKLGAAEKLSPEDQLLVNTAAVYHDSGYLESYKNNEEIAVKLARRILPEYGYTLTQIKTICAIIRSTKARAVPKTRLEKIMNDADYDYLGKNDYHKTAERLFSEWEYLGTAMSRRQWLQKQISFLEKHKYYTETAKRLRAPQKQKNVESLKKKLTSGR
jgi:class 3 adenylate cyclase/HD superfamily phosphodiesterase